jgi:PKD repeat protein
MTVLFFLIIAYFTGAASTASAVSVADDGYYKISTPSYNAWVNQSTGIIDYYANFDESYTYIHLGDTEYFGKVLSTTSRLDPTIQDTVVTVISNSSDFVVINAATNDGVVSETYNFYDSNFFAEVNSTENYTYYTSVSSNFTRINNYGDYPGIPVSNYLSKYSATDGKILLFNDATPATCPQIFMQWNLNATDDYDYKINSALTIAFGRSGTIIDCNESISFGFQTNENRSIVASNKYLVQTQWLVPNGDISKYGYNIIESQNINMNESYRRSANNWVTKANGNPYWWSFHEINPAQIGLFTDSMSWFQYNTSTDIFPVWTQDTGLYSAREWHNFDNITGTQYSATMQRSEVSAVIDNLAPITIATHIPYALSDLDEFENSISSNPYVEISKIGESEQGRDIKVYHITDPLSPYTLKRKIFIAADAHAAAESATIYAVEGIVTSILNSSDALEKADWYIIPCQNPDGVYIGSSRYNSNSVDINRDWIDLTQSENICINEWINQNAPFDGLFDIHNNPSTEGLGWSTFRDSVNYPEFAEMLNNLEQESGYVYYPGTGEPSTARASWVAHGYGDTCTIELAAGGVGLSQSSMRLDGVDLFQAAIPAYGLNKPYDEIRFKFIPPGKVIINKPTVININGTSNFVSDGETFLASELINGFVLIPSIDNLNVTVSAWSQNTKTWHESNTEQNITHIISDLPANHGMQIYRDGTLYENVLTNSSGVLTWIYDGGFSDHEFSLEPSPSDFEPSVRFGSAPVSIKFEDNSTNATSWYWDFENDGIIDSIKQNPAHTYGKAGNYTVNLTVQNEYGNFSTVKQNYIRVYPPTWFIAHGGEIDVEVISYTENYANWKESSETHDAYSEHIMGGFPSNSEIDIYVDGIKYVSPISSSTGYITFDYSGGFSEHDFEAIVATDANLMFDSLAGIVTGSTAMILVVVVVMMVGIAIGILQGKISMEILFPTIIGLLIVMVCIYAMYGIATQIQSAFGY